MLAKGLKLMTLLLSQSSGKAEAKPPLRVALVEDQRDSRPNIFFILTDDQRWNTLGCMGDTNILTPNIDRLAWEGVLFRNHFVTTSICCCSRASIFSGQYLRRHGIGDFATRLQVQPLTICFYVPPRPVCWALFHLNFLSFLTIMKKGKTAPRMNSFARRNKAGIKIRARLAGITFCRQRRPAAIKSFPIVGPGASAGGQGVLEKFFARLSPASGRAFVVTHLSPGHVAGRAARRRGKDSAA
jgi:hypothetical protein